jgi:hypothetical protein
VLNNWLSQVFAWLEAQMSSHKSNKFQLGCCGITGNKEAMLVVLGRN